VNGGVQGFPGLKNGIGARGTVTAGGLKTSGIDHEYLAIALDGGAMGMAVDHAVGLREDIEKGAFNIQAKAGTMGQANGELP